MRNIPEKIFIVFSFLSTLLSYKCLILYDQWEFCICIIKFKYIILLEVVHRVIIQDYIMEITGKLKILLESTNILKIMDL